MDQGSVSSRRQKSALLQAFIASVLAIVVMALEPTRWVEFLSLGVLVVWLSHATSELTGSSTDFRVLLLLGALPLMGELAVPTDVAPTWFNVVKAAAWIAFPFWTARLLFRVLYESHEVTVYELYGTFAVYLMLGWGFANMQVALYLAAPGSLTFATVAEGQAPTLSDFLYFSFVTLGTVGYGDVAPVNRAARLLAMSEAFLGLMFIAVVVGRMVGIATAQTRARRAAEATLEANAAKPRGSDESFAGLHPLQDEPSEPLGNRKRD